MWIPWQWPRASNDRAIANARLGTTECSRRRLERAEVEQLLATRRPDPAPSSHPRLTRSTNLTR